MSGITIDFQGCIAQARAHNWLRPGNRVCTPWGRGVGKSSFMRWQWYLNIARYAGVVREKSDGTKVRGIRIVLAMPTLTQARKVHIGASPGIDDELAGPWKFLGGHLNRSTWRIEFPRLNSWVQIVTADKPDSSRGVRADFACFDESDDIDPSFYDAVAGPWFSEPHSLNMTLVAGTPKRGRRGFLWRAHHEWPRLLRDKARSYHATAYDTKHVSRIVVDEQKATIPEEIFKREWMCDFDALEGVVYSEFVERFHVRQPPAGTQFTEVIIGGDHGLVDPSVLLVIGIQGSGRDVTAWVLEEFYDSGRDPFYWQAIAKKLIERFPTARWYCDPSGVGQSSNAMYATTGARMRNVDKSAGSVERGIGMVKRWLKVHQRRSDSRQLLPDQEYARLYVHPRCKNTIAEFALYRHKRDSRDSNIVTEDILPGNDHCLDSLRYALMNHFPDLLQVRDLSNLPAR